MTSLLLTLNFVEKDGVLYKGPPGGEELQTAEEGVRPGAVTVFDGVEKEQKWCSLKLKFAGAPSLAMGE